MRLPDRDFEDRPYKGTMRMGGFVRTYPNGIKVYITRRKQKDIYCDYAGGLSEALRTDKARWAIDIQALYAMRALGVPFAAIDVTDTGDLFVTRLEKFFDDGPTRKWKRHAHASKDGAEQRDLPLSEFMVLRGAVKIKLGA